MSNVRVHELAKNLGMTSKDLIGLLAKEGIPAKSHMSALDPETVELIVALLKEEKTPTAAPPAQAEPAVSKKTKAAVKKKGDSLQAAAAPTEPAVSKEPAPGVIPKSLHAEVSPTSVEAPVEVPEEVTPQPAPAEAPVSAVGREPAEAGKIIRIGEAITVKELSERLSLKPQEVIKKLIEMKVMASINQLLDVEAARSISEKFGFRVEGPAPGEEGGEVEDVEELARLEPRAPVVTIMGHVDHGKTSLLDAIRKTNVTGGEAGGITQHIGAYEVQTDGRKVTFLDTPGHEAFTAMRSRGAQVTDIVVLVVAADDGVMPQTREAIAHARAAKVPIVVAVNKIDKPGANPERVRQQLSEEGLVAEAWGGDTIYVEVSAKKSLGIENLLEMILLQADILELKANPHRPAKGVIIDSKLDRGRGPVATVLVQSGTLRVGDPFVTGTHFGKVRALLNYRGQKIDVGGPSTPVEVLGLSGVPSAGDSFKVVSDDRKARQIAAALLQKQRDKERTRMTRVTLEDLFAQIQQGAVKELNIVLKADVQGSVEAISDALEKLSTAEVRLKVIHGDAGGITETDVTLALASNAIIIGFSVRPTPQAHQLADREQVDVRLYTVIYEVVNDIRAAMEGLLEPTMKEKVLGRAEVREVYIISRVGTVAGCVVSDGLIPRGSEARLVRDNVIVYEGKVGSLRRFKEDVREVAAGYECGIGLEKFNDIKVGDVIEAFAYEAVARKL
ncbi:MAG: translation initiation factor IF-2 [Candidatus Tectomicrobia bacterium]|uniref:Translation initiation factor IF-2 n=1 Tax=Tectimicrobiota bacterium TaxID=2528274 RepID=A0A932LZS8_UNCTE|nr:translation initiation factor IF-2 [Candidatus Tectomicrobia bacterium]